MKKLVLFLTLSLLLVACARRQEPDAGDKVPRTSGGVLGSCVERYSPNEPDGVTAREVAFDGVVTDIGSVPAGESAPEGETLPDQTEVTFNVSRWYKGGSGASVTLKSSVPIGSANSADFPSIQRGGRYLVSGDGGFMWACGFTRNYSAAEAQQWADAFGAGDSGSNSGSY
ncbi:MAG: hypothetical protein ACRD1T_21170 [Acidimicrobiia bacterium]